MKATLCLLAAAIAGYCGSGCVSAKHAAENEAISVARVMAINSSAALASRKEREARGMVSSISGSPDVAFVLLFDQDQKLFADYFQPDVIPRKNELLTQVKNCLPIGSDFFVEQPDLVIAISRVDDASRLLGFVAVGVRKK
jgi:Periplasmic sensor domain